MRKLLILITILIAVTTLSYFILKELTTKDVNTENKQEAPIDETPKDETPTPEPEPTPETITYDEKPATEGANYFEKVIRVKSELVYLAYPITIEKEASPRLIVYSHGSNTTVSKDFSDPFMKDMQMYGEYFTKRGYAFSASSLHGANWGSNQSVTDIVDQIKYIKSKYLIRDKINLLAFSMGGLPVFNYSFAYPETINSVALLAPTSRTYIESQFKSIRKLPIQIWHGNKDVNVPYSLSTSLISRSNDFGYTNIKLKTIEGAGHFDIDIELRKSILDFYKLYE